MSTGTQTLVSIVSANNDDDWRATMEKLLGDGVKCEWRTIDQARDETRAGHRLIVDAMSLDSDTISRLVPALMARISASSDVRCVWLVPDDGCITAEISSFLTADSSDAYVHRQSELMDDALTWLLK